MRALRMLTIALGMGATLATPAMARDTAATDAKANPDELAKKLQNPVAALIRVPFQNNADWGAGAGGDGFQYKLNIQPVIPITLNERWNLISRTILPLFYQQQVIVIDRQGLALRSLKTNFRDMREIIMMPGVGHTPPEERPEEINAIVLKFVKDIGF